MRADWNKPDRSPTPKKPFSVRSRKSKEFLSPSVFANRSEESVTCTFCKQGHPSARCAVVTNIEATRNLLKREGCCFICSRRNHLARNCSQSKTCCICLGRHHMSVCEKANSRLLTSENTAQGNKVMTVNVVNEKNRLESKSSSTVYVYSNTSILLLTANTSMSQINQPRFGYAQFYLTVAVGRATLPKEQRKDWECFRR